MRKMSRVLFILALSLPAAVYSQQNPKTPSSEQGTQSAVAQKRIALVLGNKDYTPGNLTKLKNPVNDADDLAAELEKLGFNVTLGKNVKTKGEMLKLINDWSTKVSHGGIALFYYAGHGIQVDGSNYLLPVSIRIASGKSAPEDVKQHGLDLESVLGAMALQDNHVNIVILDACRSNLRDFTRGLAPIVGFRGTYIAYATAPGAVASDGVGRNGLFTKHLLKNIGTPKLKIEEMFKSVRRDVASDKNNDVQQLPWDASSLLEEVVLNPGSYSSSTSEMTPGTSPTPESIPNTRVTSDGPKITINMIPISDPQGGPESSVRIEGEASGVDLKNSRVVLYSWTDKWYVQPTQAEPYTEIGQDGKWSAIIHGGTRYAALLVKPDFNPPYITFQLPRAGGEVLAVTVAMGQKP